MSSIKGVPESEPLTISTSPVQDTAMDMILLEIRVMDSTICTIAAKTKSIGLDIAGFQARVTGLEQRMTKMVDHFKTIPDRDQELLHLRSMLIDLEERSLRDNVHFFGFPEQSEGTDVQDFFQSILPTIPGLTFDPPVGISEGRSSGTTTARQRHLPRQIITCLLRHGQARRLIMVARAHGPY
ncbi:hypothetical protein NDU88_004132 [Pleurodeles waltl]|uniref:Uncharacterized protein n=1 Tax=Pleurodeles waltl TaxID=8319 RepID=A0AAV7W9G6_PLEWA|nr:hypothetical protein NDU88_004132 [Pleurodeles waltl]